MATISQPDFANPNLIYFSRFSPDNFWSEPIFLNSDGVYTLNGPNYFEVIDPFFKPKLIHPTIKDCLKK